MEKYSDVYASDVNSQLDAQYLQLYSSVEEMSSQLVSELFWGLE
jgi:hypothetical protein